MIQAEIIHATARSRPYDFVLCRNYWASCFFNYLIVGSRKKISALVWVLSSSCVIHTLTKNNLIEINFNTYGWSLKKILADCLFMFLEMFTNFGRAHIYLIIGHLLTFKLFINLLMFVKKILLRILTEEIQLLNLRDTFKGIFNISNWQSLHMIFQ